MDITEDLHDNTSHACIEYELLKHECRHRISEFPEISFHDFLNADSNVIYTKEISDDAVISGITNGKEMGLSGLEEEEIN